MMLPCSPQPPPRPGGLQPITLLLHPHWGSRRGSPRPQDLDCGEARRPCPTPSPQRRLNQEEKRQRGSGPDEDERKDSRVRVSFLMIDPL